MWVEPIYDRTEIDVINKTSKGYLNIEDLNRIENNCAYLGEKVGASVSTITWTHDTLPTVAQFDRILNNLTMIKNNWQTITENNPDQPINTYEKVNSIEKILDDIYLDYLDVTEVFMRCGEGYCNNYDIL